jgi:hypothetical protein
VFSNALPERTDYLLVLRSLAVIGVTLGHRATIGQNIIGFYLEKSLWLIYPAHISAQNAFRYALFCITPILSQNF